MIRGLDQAAKSLGIAPEANSTKAKHSDEQSNSSDDIPMMYRAQVKGRCSLMFAGDNEDLENWKDEWVNPNPEQPRYQKKQPSLGLDGEIYRILVKFPFRLVSNCGQDSIIRPIIGKDGIPYLSGSSVKGLFRRACNTIQTKKYCGDDENLVPSSLGFRFHGAYPVGDWGGTQKVTVWRNGETITEVRYRMLDVIHPQQERQVGSDKHQKATALASVSLYKPTMIFEFSSSDTNVDWTEVEDIFWESIALGVGGKTSIGYGLGGYNDCHPAGVPKSKVHIALKGRGVSPTLRSDEPEFRPNLFKASLRGHFRRLLAGVVDDLEKLDPEVDRLFGSSSSPGVIQLSWQQKEVNYSIFGKTQTFQAEGILHLNATRDNDVQLIEQVLKFSFIMGGFGKSWRRASHELFYKTYKKFEIGCHWELSSTNWSWMLIKSTNELRTFLEGIHQTYAKQYASSKLSSQNWRESWHPDRLSVYATVTRESKAIKLFHDDIYKYTPAIGGKNLGDKRPKFISSVWHRMLPIGEGSFLEIITIFHAKREEWDHHTEGDQLYKFVQSLENQGLSFTWGNPKPPAKKAKRMIPNPQK